MPENRELEVKLFTNEEVLKVNQQGENPRQLYKTDSASVWISNVKGSKDFYVAVFNIGDNAAAVKVDFSQLGLKGKILVRDLWKKKDVGIVKKEFAATLNGHASTLLRVSLK